MFKKKTSLVSLPGEGDPLAVVHALVDGDLEYLPLARHLLAGARLAAELGVDALPLALALAAHRLDLSCQSVMSCDFTAAISTEFPIPSFIEVFQLSFREFPWLVGRSSS